MQSMHSCCICNSSLNKALSSGLEIYLGKMHCVAIQCRKGNIISSTTFYSYWQVVLSQRRIERHWQASVAQVVTRKVLQTLKI
jgi:hypothetical protein